MSEMVFEEFKPDKGVANLTGRQSFWALIKNVCGQLGHGYKLMTGKTLCPIMLIIHVLC